MGKMLPRAASPLPVDWIHGHIDMARRMLEGELEYLLKAHRLDNAAKEVRAAIYALSRARSEVGKAALSGMEGA